MIPYIADLAARAEKLAQKHLTAKERKLAKGPRAALLTERLCKAKPYRPINVAIANGGLAGDLVVGFSRNSKGLDFEDLYAACFVGLYEAARRYKLGQGKFAGYARHYAKSEMSKAYQDRNETRVSKRDKRRFKTIVAKLNAEHIDTGNTSTNRTELLAAGFSRDDAETVSILFQQKIGRASLSLDEQLATVRSIAEAPEDEPATDAKSVKAHILLETSGLTKREHYVVSCTCGFNGITLTIPELAKSLGISTAVVRRDWETALEKMKKAGHD